MFSFTVKYFGFLKFVPGLAIVFDAWLKIHTLITKPILLDWIDLIETRMLSLPNTTTHNHKYGGLQFDRYQTEIGHIHSNGLLDMLLTRKIKANLMQQGRILDHHSFKNTGWISFYIRTEGDVQYALELLQLGYERIGERE
ncbi:luciferase family protein [Mucilaginibacter dorajii]|uniref:Luciferase domain-containing protein n=1 Tax=Mucilaginibacter dorajii TaxID=692994 RepID=A0ABP7Q0X8_9SPHI|nr:luciferase family protein [Mucilaginibacter dorajii]MCS3732868.1 hypothetical protein [Mucilaginibacter dorajii]